MAKTYTQFNNTLTLVTGYSKTIPGATDRWYNYGSTGEYFNIQDIDGEVSGDQSGYSVSMNSAGDRVAIGAIGNSGNGGASGSTRIYSWNSGESTWVKMGQDIDGEAVGDYSGYSVSMNSAGDRVAIGASYNDAKGGDTGSTRIYSWNSGESTWVKMGQDIDGEFNGDQFGYSVSMNSAGDRVAIGAIGNDGNGNAYDSGSTRIYSWNSGESTWVKMGQDIDGEAAFDQSGHSVSMNSAGDRVAIGAKYNNGNGSDSGSVRIYSWNSGTSIWVKMGQDIDGEAAVDYSGYSVSMNSTGDRVAIGATYNDGNGGDSGSVRIYSWNSGTSIWVKMGQDIDGEAAVNRSGNSVSMNSAGDRVAIGAEYNSGNGAYSGSTRIYFWNSGESTWVKMGQDIDGESAYDQSGHSVSMNSAGDRVAIGAINNDGNGYESGSVRIYSWSGNMWLRLTKENPDTAGYFSDGYCVDGVIWAGGVAGIHAALDNGKLYNYTLQSGLLKPQSIADGVYTLLESKWHKGVGSNVIELVTGYSKSVTGYTDKWYDYGVSGTDTPTAAGATGYFSNGYCVDGVISTGGSTGIHTALDNGKLYNYTAQTIGGVAAVAPQSIANGVYTLLESKWHKGVGSNVIELVTGYSKSVTGYTNKWYDYGVSGTNTPTAVNTGYFSDGYYLNGTKTTATGVHQALDNSKYYIYAGTSTASSVSLNLYNASYSQEILLGDNDKMYLSASGLELSDADAFNATGKHSNLLLVPSESSQGITMALSTSSNSTAVELYDVSFAPPAKIEKMYYPNEDGILSYIPTDVTQRTIVTGLKQNIPWHRDKLYTYASGVSGLAKTVGVDHYSDLTIDATCGENGSCDGSTEWSYTTATGTDNGTDGLFYQAGVPYTGDILNVQALDIINDEYGCSCALKSITVSFVNGVLV